MLARSLAQAIRVHQWPKNLLVFVPVLASPKMGDLALLRDSLVAFIAFCFAASAIYLINDAFDIDHDRKHPTKRLRPFAAGTLAIGWCYILAPAFIILSFAIGFGLGLSFLAVLVVYTVLALAYSAGLKRALALDVIVIALLYELRVIAGYEATGLVYSVWLLSFTQSLFLSLALMKRDIELATLQVERAAGTGRGYMLRDRNVIVSAGIASGLISILVFSLYIESNVAAELYRSPRALWLACPILAYGVLRIWMLANRDAVQSDPVLFVLRDPVSYVLSLSLAIVGLAARFGFPFPR